MEEGGLEGRVAVLENEIGAVKGDVAGLKKSLETNTAMTAEMFQAYTTAKNGVRMIGRAGDAVMAVSDLVERRPKTTALSLVGGIVTYQFATTGKLPDWFGALMKALLA